MSEAASGSEKKAAPKKVIKRKKIDRVAIVSGLRTPFAKQSTHFRRTSAIEMGQMVVNELMIKTELDPKLIERVVFGQVLISPDAPNIAREIVLGTPMSVHTDGYSISRACATSFQTIASLAESIMVGDVSIGIAGGADSSSVVPIGVSKRLSYALVDLQKARSFGQKMAILKKLRPKDLAPVPPAVKEFSTGITMGQTAEQMARDRGITREEQDALAHRSHSLAAKAWEDGKLDGEVMAAHVSPYDSEPLVRDNIVRFNSTLEGYAKLRPAFDRKYGTLTAANSTPLSDGASAVVLMSESKAKAMGYEPLGYIKSYDFAAIDAGTDMLMGPSYATPRALKKAKMQLKDLDLIDMHEAFAAQALSNMQAFGSTKFAKEKLGQRTKIGDIDMDKFNVNGSSIAYGHPFAATGARMITQTLNELKRRGGGVGLTTACAAGGLGAAMIVEVD